MPSTRRPWDGPELAVDPDDPGRAFVCKCGRLAPPGQCAVCDRRLAGDGVLVGPLVAVATLLLLALVDRVQWAAVPLAGRAIAGVVLVLVLAGTATVAAVVMRKAWLMRYGLAP